jgi:pimeloyl-ACP methyl ester carboxylesterase
VIVTPDERSALRELGDYREIPGGYHHLMLDAPDALAAVLLDTLAAQTRTRCRSRPSGQ